MTRSPPYLTPGPGLVATPAAPAAADGPGWSASLDLRFAVVAGRTRLIDNRHHGPLRLLKSLPGRYPDDPLEVVILHPPGGLAGGDSLAVSLALDEQARVLATTPGAQKWYRQGRATGWATASTRLDLAAGACLEWLPQPAILYDGAWANQTLAIDLRRDSRCTGWEILVRGRAAMGERFATGRLAQSIRLAVDGVPWWDEVLRVDAGDRWFASPLGWRDCPVAATVWCAAPAVPEAQLADVLAGWREALSGAVAAAMHGGASQVVPGLLLARLLGHDSEAVLLACQALWRSARNSLPGQAGAEPRIWST